jgi:hypothetical protein
VLTSLVRAASVVACLLVLLGWALFAYDETKSASDLTRDELSGRAVAQQVDPSPDQERRREAAHSKAHEAIDDANDVLLKPFAGVADTSHSRWVRRTVPAVLALLVYGLAVAFALRFMQGRASRPGSRPSYR